MSSQPTTIDRALTVCQPYAWAIIHGPKRVENRNWKSNFRGWLAIHAGKSKSWMAAYQQNWHEETYGVTLPDPDDLVYGAIIGLAHIDACLHHSYFPDDPFATGLYCWRISQVKPLVEPIPARGSLGLWRLDKNTQAAIARSF